MIADKKTFVDFVVTQFQIHIPNLQLTQDTPSDIFSFKGTFTNMPKIDGKDVEIQIFLGNAYENYIKTKDIGIVNSFINTFKAQSARIIDYSNFPEKSVINEDNIYPLIRTDSLKIADSAKDSLISKPLGANLRLLLIEDSPEYIVYVTNKAILNNFSNDDDAIKKSFDNLKKIGWTPATFSDKIPSKDITISVFENNSPFHGQFLLKDWTSKHLADSFYISFPNKNIVITMSSNTEEITNKEIFAMMLYSKQVMDSSPGALNNQVYLYKDYQFSSAH